MWRLGFFFHEMGFGLLSIFLPLYVLTIGGSLIEVGVLVAVSLTVAIPASFFWGYICDKTRRYKRYILLSFLASATLLYLFTFTTSLVLLTVLYAVMAVVHVAHEAPKNVLIAESYPRQNWERTFALYEALTEVGWLIGLLLGVLLSASGLEAAGILFVCSGLNLLAFLVSVFLVADPLLIFERSLVNIERTIDFAHRGVFVASRMLDGEPVSGELKKENVNAFCVGLILFALATSALFTPMPVFISNVAQAASLPSSVVFLVFVLNSVGGIAGYLWARERTERSSVKNDIGRIAMLRGLLTFSFIAVLYVQYNTIALATVVLVSMGLVYAMFLVYSLSLSMEFIPAGRSGLFNVLIGTGGAAGAFVGPFVGEVLGFGCLFLFSGAVFVCSFVAFKIFD